MSIEANYRRITPEEFNRLQADPKAAESFFGTSLDDFDDRYLDIGTDWHALHFLLTGDGELKPQPLPPSPLAKVVQGGTETTWPCTYGHVRSLTPDEVQTVADALARISVDYLRSRFSVESFNTAQIYPHGRRARWTAEDAESVFEIYPSVVKFFQAAARDGDMILLSSD